MTRKEANVHDICHVSFKRTSCASARRLPGAVFPGLGVAESGRRLPRDIQAAHNCWESDSVRSCQQPQRESDFLISISKGFG